MTIEVVATYAKFSPGELWELMWRRTVTEHWLGAGSIIPTDVGSRVLLSDAAGPWRRGRLRKVAWADSLSVALDPAPTWPEGDREAHLTISVAANAGHGVTLRIAEAEPSSDEHRAEILQYWTAVRDRLSDLIGEVSSRRESPRQAVIVIHGIGEQEPGRTLRTLIDSGVIGDRDARSYVKPDRVTGSFELRTVTFSASTGRVRPTTDVYEMYWAHLIRDTTLSQVAGWARGLLFRRGVPRPLAPAWTLTWVTILSVGLLVLGQVTGVWEAPVWIKAGGVVLVGAALAWRLLGQDLVINRLGDAARYFNPRPGNVAHRQEIRQAGVDLLDRLHERGIYDRIVILGHSLGSVIAYDVLTYAWLRYHNEHRSPSRTDFKPLIAVERAIKKPGMPNMGDLQHSAWLQSRRNTQPWLVTDLITVGSPLTYAGFLMSPGREQFLATQRDRILPTCPPQTSRLGSHERCTFDRHYFVDDARRKSANFTVCDHGALFAVTRWTNLYFRVRLGGLVGDLIGGPVAPEFGSWVSDIELQSPCKRVTHTWYWRPAEPHAHIAALKDALRMESGQELMQLAAETPAFVIAERLVSARH